MKIVKSKPKLLIRLGETICHQELLESSVAQALSMAIPHEHDSYGEQQYIADADYYIQFIKKSKP